MTTTLEFEAAHPRFVERREAVEDANLRRRRRQLIAAAVIAGLALLALGVTRSPLLDVDEVRVIGADALAPQIVRSVGGLELGSPLIGLERAAAEERLAALPAVASATVSRAWDGLVTIEITEREPAALFTVPERELLVSTDGIILSSIPVDGTPTGPHAATIEAAGTADGVPLISGAMFGAAVGDRVPREVHDVLTVAAALPADLARLTDRVEISVDRVVLRLVGGGAVDLDDARNLDDKFDAVRTVVAQVDLACLDEVNVTAPMVPVVTRSSSCG